MESIAVSRPDDDPNFRQAAWRDAELLPAPTLWSGLSENRVPANTHGFDDKGLPKSWPLRFSNAHWAAVIPGVPEGEYTFRSRTIDEKGNAQPLPRPFRKSGHAAIESIVVTVKD